MAQCCVVSICSSRTSGHRIPKDPELHRKWLVAISGQKFKPSDHSRVCTEHFTGKFHSSSMHLSLRTPVLLNNSPIIRLSNIHEQCQD
ncbi:hypothetical protein NQ315_015170 [Exocentrus adspersus]|uniref:THAP-type domain-containing protein n=1 Tax=Exocentrus adspersus TaxID=1586481 RepID=A0AAV8VBZ4_9CUCU|nr:hypothetical protein NQ315_015170 [Exocentrus adspersus]